MFFDLYQSSKGHARNFSRSTMSLSALGNFIWCASISVMVSRKSRTKRGDSDASWPVERAARAGSREDQNFCRRRNATVLAGALAYIFHTWQPFGWVEQATRLCRSATRRPEANVTLCSHDATLWPRVAFGLPPGQWPGGTGESPVPPRTMKYAG
jgi:hypothetical protein